MAYAVDVCMGAMRNLCSLTQGQPFPRSRGAMLGNAGNLASLPGIFPDYAAPIVCAGADGVSELALARWGTEVSSPAAYSNSDSDRSRYDLAVIFEIRAV